MQAGTGGTFCATESDVWCLEDVKCFLRNEKIMPEIWGTCYSKNNKLLIYTMLSPEIVKADEKNNIYND
mgnify:CR=1 FL=1